MQQLKKLNKFIDFIPLLWQRDLFIF